MEEVRELGKTTYELNGLWHVWGRTEMHTGFWLVSLSNRKKPLGTLCTNHKILREGLKGTGWKSTN